MHMLYYCRTDSILCMIDQSRTWLSWESMSDTCWKTVIQKHLTLPPIFWAKAQNVFLLDDLSKDVCISNHLQLEIVSLSGAKGAFAYNLERCRISFPEQWTDMLTAQYKGSGSLKMTFLYCNQLCVPVSLGPLCVILWGLRLRELV